MGYHLTVLKTTGSKLVPITHEQFITACEKHPELSLGTDKTTADLNKDGALFARLFYQEGTIWTKVPEEEVLIVLLSLAKELNARVRGSEGETYRTSTETYQHPDDATQAHEGEIARRKRRKRRLTWNIIRFLILAGAVGLLIANAIRK